MQHSLCNNFYKKNYITAIFSFACRTHVKSAIIEQYAWEQSIHQQRGHYVEFSQLGTDFGDITSQQNLKHDHAVLRPTSSLIFRPSFPAFQCCTQRKKAGREWVSEVLGTRLGQPPTCTTCKYRTSEILTLLYEYVHVYLYVLTLNLLLAENILKETG